MDGRWDGWIGGCSEWMRKCVDDGYIWMFKSHFEYKCGTESTEVVIGVEINIKTFN